MKNIKKNNVWKSFKKFINSQQVGTVITRQQIIGYVEKDCKMFCIGNGNVNLSGNWNGDKFEVNKSFSVTTIDYIRNLSEKVGYLDKTRHAGMYVVNKHFPSGYTVSQLRKDYDSRTW